MRKTFLITAMALSVALLTSCQENEAAKENKEVVTPVETAKAVQDDLVIEKTFYARTAPASTTPIIAPIPGEITRLEVENGDIVEEDDLIATIAGRQNIYAPISGEIANLTAEEGAIASNSDPIAVVADLDHLKLQFNVTADQLDLFKKGNKYEAVIDGEKRQAEVTSISKLPNETGLFPVEATIVNKEKDFLPGVVSKVTVPEEKIEDAILVPTEAVMQEGGKSFVYIVDGDQVVKTIVTIKETQSNNTAIDGVKKGDVIITSGQLTLTDGSKVDVVKEGNQS